MIRVMLELIVIAALVTICFAVGAGVGHRFSGMGVLVLTPSLIGITYVALEALVALHRDWENLGAAILFWFYILPSILGFGGGVAFGCWRDRERSR